MLVKCPSCRTTYKVADEVVKGAAPAFRCSRCKHTFELEGAESAPTTAVTPAASASAGYPGAAGPRTKLQLFAVTGSG